MNKLKTEDALKAVLLFHSGSPWDFEKNQEWQMIAHSALGNPHDYYKMMPSFHATDFEATTKVLCDIVRSALKPL